MFDGKISKDFLQVQNETKMSFLFNIVLEILVDTIKQKI